MTFLDRVRAVARECGYAVAVHGSEQRDLDLIAVPWTPEAVSADQLVARLCESVPLVEHEQAGVAPNPEMKPWGRVAWALAGCPSPHRYVDLSVAPRAGEPVPLMPERDWRRQAMSDAKDALACGDGEGAWAALNRHERGPREHELNLMNERTEAR